MTTTIEKRGTVKRTQQGTLVAEIEWHQARDLIGGKDLILKVGDTEARVLDVGDRFKRSGYAFAYVYLAEPQAPAPAASAHRQHPTEADEEEAFYDLSGGFAQPEDS